MPSFEYKILKPEFSLNHCFSFQEQYTVYHGCHLSGRAFLQLFGEWSQNNTWGSFNDTTTHFGMEKH